MSAPDRPLAKVATVSMNRENEVILTLGMDEGATKIEFELDKIAVAVLALTIHPTLLALKATMPTPPTAGVPDSPEGL